MLCRSSSSCSPRYVRMVSTAATYSGLARVHTEPSPAAGLRVAMRAGVSNAPGTSDEAPAGVGRLRDATCDSTGNQS